MSPLIASEEGQVTFTKTVLVVSGLYMWDYAVSLQFDRHLVRDLKRSWWVKCVYILCRASSLVFFITSLADLTLSVNNCRLTAKLVSVSAGVTALCTTGLIGIRVIAIWKKNAKLILLVTVLLISELVTFIIFALQIGAARDPNATACNTTNADSFSLPLVVVLVCDFLFTSAMFVGLQRVRSSQTLGIWRFLWNQGVIWLFTLVLVEVPIVTLVYLNINAFVNRILVALEVAAVTIVATRLYRGLYIFSHDDRNMEFLSNVISMRTRTGKGGRWLGRRAMNLVQ